MERIVTNAEPIAPIRLSIAVRAWNEERVIRRTLESVFQQSLFEELQRRHERCEVICIPNGCTDRTAEIAAAVFAEQRRSHPFAGAFSCRVAEIREAGRNNTWNAFVHELSSSEAEFLYIMDSDILFDRPETLFNMRQPAEHPRGVDLQRSRHQRHLAQEKEIAARPPLAGHDRHDTNHRGADDRPALLHPRRRRPKALSSQGPGCAG
jgi:glycosyltransferase involved in cell wall biosynthesis